MARSKTHYKDPNRRSNWFKGEQVPSRRLPQERLKRFDALMQQGKSEAEALAQALEIIPNK